MSGRFPFGFTSHIRTIRSGGRKQASTTKRGRGFGLVAGLVVALLASGEGKAFEALDGRVQAHGFYEMQMRAMSADYAEDWDMTQWYHVFNLELEVDILPDGFGFLDLLQGYVRAEVRYDCVYSSGCGMFRSVNTYGDRSKSLPRRLSNARQRTATGTIAKEFSADGETQDLDRRSEGTTDPVPLDKVSGFSTLAGSPGADQAIGSPSGPRLGGDTGCLTDFVSGIAASTPSLTQTTCDSLVGGELGIEVGGTLGTIAQNDDPFRYVFERFEDFRFTQINGRGGSSYGLPTRVFGPWLPNNFFQENAALADRINPFDRDETSPVLAAAVFNTAFLARFNDNLATIDTTDSSAVEVARQDAQAFAKDQSQRVSGSGANPYRPIPVEGPGRYGVNDASPRGIYLPSRGLQRRVGNLDNPEFNFREAERAWNRGASQQDEKELKEAYIDAEFFDSRLWIRAGRQSIVWGKTELFRTTDQFNPQDLGLASLPSLEESRIALWAMRAVYSFYEVGPFSDVRLEGAFNWDAFEPTDLGACGEAYTVNAACELTFGMFAHGTAGIGVAGVQRPKDPWESTDGWEVGARLEWRWDRFSFAITEFWGYNDFPTLERISTYERNVDPDTGRPRRFGARGSCTASPDSIVGPQEDDCLKPGPINREVYSVAVVGEPGDVGPTVDTADRIEDDGNALLFHHVNQQLFAMICSTTIGFSSLDRASCAQTVFGSTADPTGVAISVSQAIGAVIRGSEAGTDVLGTLLLFGAPGSPINTDIKAPTIFINAPELFDPSDPDDATEAFTTVELPGNGGTACRNSLNVFGQRRPLQPGRPPREEERPLCGGNDPSNLRSVAHNQFAVDGVALAQGLSAEQEALFGCGPFWSTNCDDDGFDLMNMELSAIIQSFSGVEGTNTGWRNDGILNTAEGQDPAGLAVDSRGRLWQPGTVGFLGATPCTFGDLVIDAGERSATERLPGCNGPNDEEYDVAKDGIPSNARLNFSTRDQVSQYYALQPADQQCDSATFDFDNVPCEMLVAGPGVHPFTLQPWQNEMAIASWNFQMLLVSNSSELTDDLERINRKFLKGKISATEALERRVRRAYSVKKAKCSFRQPQFCGTPEAFFAISGVTRSTVEAGGSGNFGRRTFAWHSGGEAILRYDKRNVLGFSADFAEDFTKSNWGMEFTWFDGIPASDANQRDGISHVDTFNLTISVDRPTFINFLNANRTFFINSQWFFQYIDGYRGSMPGNGSYNVLATFAISTGYYQDRLLPSVVFVYDFQSVSSAVLPQVTYRYNEAFSIIVGAAVFAGRQQLADRPINPLGGVGNLQGGDREKVGAENGLAAIRDRDEIYLRLRYTF